MPATTAGWVALGAATTGGVAIYSAVESRRQAKAAESKAKKQQQLQQQQYLRELEAGEYFQELSRKQMELQAQAANIKTLADLVVKRKEPETRIYTLPTAYKPTPVEQINQAIGRLFGV